MTLPVPGVVAEPERIVVTRWRCPFCARSRASKAATVAHIGRCWRNPANRACTTCVHLEPADYGHPDDTRDTCAALQVLPVGTAFPVTGCPVWQAGPGVPVTIRARRPDTDELPGQEALEWPTFD